MTHTYNISGMTCGSCSSNVQKLLASVSGVKNVEVDLKGRKAIIEMSEHVPLNELKAALSPQPKFTIEAEQEIKTPIGYNEETEVSWFSTYKPILLVFAYITGITLLTATAGGNFHWHTWMQNFMAAFFLIFSFFKFLDLRGFADGYATYDIIAMRWKSWGYIYAFVELGLGMAYLIGFEPLATNVFTFLIMSVSIIGVLQSVLNKRKIKCACLGAVFNLPMSTVTVIEDGLMIAMSVIMIIINL